MHAGLEVLDICASNSTFVTLEEVDALLHMQDEIRDAELDKMLTLQNVDSEFWSSQLLCAVDTVTRKIFDDIPNRIGFNTKVYTDRLWTYFDEVVAVIEVQRRDHPLLDRAVARLKWILF